MMQFSILRHYLYSFLTPFREIIWHTLHKLYVPMHQGNQGQAPARIFLEIQVEVRMHLTSICTFSLFFNLTFLRFFIGVSNQLQVLMVPKKLSLRRILEGL